MLTRRLCQGLGTFLVQMFFLFRIYLREAYLAVQLDEITTEWIVVSGKKFLFPSLLVSLIHWCLTSILNLL